MVFDYIRSQIARNREIFAYGSLSRARKIYIEPDTRRQSSIQNVNFGGGFMAVRDDDSALYGDGEGGGNRRLYEGYAVNAGGGQGTGGIAKRIALTKRLTLTLYGGVGGGGGGVAVIDQQEGQATYSAGGANILSLRSGIGLDYRIGGRVGLVIGVRIGQELPLLQFVSKDYPRDKVHVRLVYGLSYIHEA